MALPAHELKLAEDEYLKLEESSAVRHEYVDGRIFAMTGATYAHNVIGTNLTVAFGARLRGSECRLFANDMKVKIESTGTFYYPDLMISCGEAFTAGSVYSSSPCLIAEILSPSTVDIDRREKLLAYKSIASLKQYAIIYQDQRRVELYSREGNNWEVSVLQEHDNLKLNLIAGLEMSISLDEIYESVIDTSGGAG